jgi:DNA polymerase-3 subunit alpha
MGFANLHTHTDYSVLDGMMSVKKAFDQAKLNGYSALGITEHSNMSSVFIAINESARTGIKYVPGIEIELKEDDSDNTRHLVVLAAGHSGLKSIFNITYTAFSRDTAKPFITWEDLDILDKKDVFVLSGSCDGLLPVKSLLYGPRVGDRIADRLVTTFEERFYIELNVPYDDKQSEINTMLLDIAGRKSIPTILALDSHFAVGDDAYLFNIFLAVQNKGSIYEKDSLFYTRPPLMTEADIRSKIPTELQSAVDTTEIVAGMCLDPNSYMAPSKEFMMPKFDVKSTANYNEFLAWKREN